MTAKINISQASRMYGKDRKTIHDAIRKRGVSTEKTKTGTLVQLTDLIAIWGEPKNSPTTPSQAVGVVSPQEATPNPTPIFAEKISLLEQQIKELHQDREERREREEQLRKEKEELLGIIKQQTLLLEDKREKIEEKSQSNHWLVYGLSAAIALVSSVAGYTLWQLWGS